MATHIDKTISEFATKMEELTGYNFTEGVPKFTDELYEVQFGNYDGKYITKTDAAQGGEPNTIYLSEDGRRKPSVLWHELAHALHFQNNPSLTSLDQYIADIRNASKQYLWFPDKYIKPVFGEKITYLKNIRHLAIRQLALHQVFEIDIEGFATWLTKKTFPYSKMPTWSSDYADGYDIHSTIEKAFGSKKTFEIAMMPRDKLGGSILNAYAAACEKLGIAQKDFGLIYDPDPLFKKLEPSEIQKLKPVACANLR